MGQLKKMFKSLIAFGLGMMALAAMAQGYVPAKGETVLKVDIDTRGSLYIKLFTAEAPNTTNQILSLVNSGFYNSQKFHRVEKSPKPFLVQIGAPGSKTKSVDDPELQKEGTGNRVAYENSGYKNDQEGMVGLSTQPGNRDSGDSQFYILLGPAKFLDGNYTVFGKVVAGIDVLRKIEKGDRVSTVSVLKG